MVSKPLPFDSINMYVQLVKKKRRDTPPAPMMTVGILKWTK